MTPEETYKAACDGDAEAMVFLGRAASHFQAIRKYIADKSTNPNELIGLMAQTNMVFSLPFYRKHAHSLNVLVMTALSSVMESDPLPNLVWSVAVIKIGFDKARKLLVKSQ